MGDNLLLKQMGERIYNKRKAMKMTQEELAEKIGVSTQMISNLECGKKAIRPENLIKICQALEISADYVLTGEISHGDIDVTAKKISQLTKEELKIINTMIDYMNGKRDN